MRRFLILGLALILLSACQPLPHPFADSRPLPGAPILALKDSAGVFVEPVAGVPPEAGRQLAESMAKALQKQDVPASAKAASRANYRLSGAVEGDRLDWKLVDARGAAVGEFAQTLGSPPSAMQSSALAGSAAPKIAAFVQGEAPVAVDVATHVLVMRVEGAPGDGPRALRQAMEAALHKAGLEVADAPGTGKEYVVAGHVEVDKPVERKQTVHIVWEVRRPGGQALGTVRQENAVPAGSLDHTWGDIGWAVASAAAGGVVDLIDKARQHPAGS
jgi:hypothetical protein